MLKLIIPLLLLLGIYYYTTNTAQPCPVDHTMIGNQITTIYFVIGLLNFFVLDIILSYLILKK